MQLKRVQSRNPVECHYFFIVAARFVDGVFTVAMLAVAVTTEFPVNNSFLIFHRVNKHGLKKSI